MRSSITAPTSSNDHSSPSERTPSLRTSVRIALAVSAIPCDSPSTKSSVRSSEPRATSSGASSSGTSSSGNARDGALELGPTGFRQPRPPPRRSDRGRRRRARPRADRSRSAVPPRGASTATTVHGDTRELLCRAPAERDLPPEARAQPTGEEGRVRLRPGHRQPLGRSDLRPELGQAAAPVTPASPRDVRDGHPSEERRQILVRGRKPRPLGGVDDEPVADVDELLELGLPPRRLTAPAAERGQVGDQERLHDRGRRLGALAPEPKLDHLRAHLMRDTVHREALHRHRDVDAVPPSRLGEEQDRPRRMALLEARERPARGSRPLRRRPRDVGHHARPQIRRAVGALQPAQLFELPLDIRDDAQCRLQLRPSRWISSSALRGPQVPAS